MVVVRRDSSLRRGAGWLREDLSSKPYAWLKSDFVPPSPFLVIKDEVAGTSEILVESHLIWAEFRGGLDALVLPVWSSSGHCGSVLISLGSLGRTFWRVGGAQKVYCWWVGWVGLE